MYAIGASKNVSQRGHIGEETIQGNMGSFGKYVTTDFKRGENTGVTDLDHHDPTLERGGGI